MEAVRGFNSTGNVSKMGAGYKRLCYILHHPSRYVQHQNHQEAGRWSQEEMQRAYEGLPRWESANLWYTQSAVLCNLLQQDRLLGAGSGKSDVQVLLGKRCSYAPGFYSSRIRCMRERSQKVEEFEWKREEGGYVRGEGLLEMGNSNTGRLYRNPGRGHASDVGALCSGKLGTSQSRGKYGKQLAFSPHSTPCCLPASVRCLVCAFPDL